MQISSRIQTIDVRIFLDYKIKSEEKAESESYLRIVCDKSLCDLPISLSVGMIRNLLAL